MLALVLMDHALRHRAQNADVVVDDAAHRGAGAGATSIAQHRAPRAVDDPDPDEA